MEVLPAAGAEHQVPQVARPFAHRAPRVLCQPREKEVRAIVGLRTLTGAQHPEVVSPAPRTHIHSLSHMLGAQQPQGLHGLEAAAGGGTGEVVEAGAAGGRPARDGGPRPPAAFTFLRAEESRRSVLLQGSQTEPLPTLRTPRDPLTCEIPEKTALATPATSGSAPAAQAAHQWCTQQCPVGRGSQGQLGDTQMAGWGPPCCEHTHLSARRAALGSPPRRSRSVPGRHPAALALGGAGWALGEAGQAHRGARGPPAARASRAPARSAAAPAARVGSSPHSCRGHNVGPTGWERDMVGVRDIWDPPNSSMPPPSPPTLTCQPQEVPPCPCSLALAPQRLLRGVSEGPPRRCPSPPRPSPHRLWGEGVSPSQGKQGQVPKVVP